MDAATLIILALIDRIDLVPLVIGGTGGLSGLGDAWSLAQLRDLLTHGGRVEPDHSVTERLAELVDANVEAVIACLGLMIDIPDRRWFILGSRDEIRSIIARGMRDRAGARKTAVEIVNRLAAQGHSEFADLLR